MCTLDRGFLLCACDEATLTELDWVLERLNPALPRLHRRGRAAIPRWSADEEAQIAFATDELNHRDCFDFDYTPREDDRLSIKLTGQRDRWIYLRYTAGAWQKDTSTSLSGWRSQLETYRTGQVDPG